MSRLGKLVAGETAEIQHTLEEIMYAKKNIPLAKKQLARFKYLMDLNQFSLDIDKTKIEGIYPATLLAIYHELCDNYQKALAYRKRELELIKQLFDLLEGEDQGTRDAALMFLSEGAITQRESIISNLEAKIGLHEHPATNNE